MMTVFGFAGLTMNESGLGLDPCLPDGWKTLAFSVQWRGRHVSVSVDADQNKIAATLTAGEPMRITVGGKEHGLTREEPLSAPFAAKRTVSLPCHGVQPRAALP
jgi:trehalose/maltose hydrolase-like predicted phosphorylase